VGCCGEGCILVLVVDLGLSVGEHMHLVIIVERRVGRAALRKARHVQSAKVTGRIPQMTIWIIA
jgi:hypothetical protein